MYFFTADEHYEHPNIITFCNRPFSNILEMNEELIKRHNEVVSSKDITVHAGDFCLNGTCKGEAAKKIIARLNGKHIFIAGTHDSWMDKTTNDKMWLWQQKIEGHHVTVSHFAMRVWPYSHYDSWLLYGHSHGRLPGEGKSMDVGVDTNDFYPYSWTKIKGIMVTKPFNFNSIEKHQIELEQKNGRTEM